MNVNNIIKNDKCTGCMCCKNICLQDCINVYRKSDGFDYPQIDEDRCLGCGECLKVCPIANTNTVKFDYTYAYAVQANDSIRMNSSSGGVFTLFALHVLKKGGIVCGASFVGNKVKHIIIDKVEELERLQGSKYVQSNTVDIYDELKDYLKNGKTVLFSGTACQCEAICNCFQKYIDQIYVIDILCMGVPSPGLFERYLNEEIGQDIKKINFRDKSLEGWNYNLYLSYERFEEKINLNNKNSSYYTAFLKGYSLRKSCYECKYAGKKRPSDISIGDFWRCGEYDSKLDDGKGTSLVIVSTEKGKNLIHAVAEECILIRKMPVDLAIKANAILLKSVSDKGRRREFFERLEDTTLKEAVYFLDSDRACCGIINYWAGNDNGAILTAYALQQALIKLGYSNRLIDCSKNYLSGGISEKFARKYLYVTSPVVSEKDYKNLNNTFDNFLVGSDQVFRAEWVPDHWFLDFVDIDKNKIAISASYGKKSLDVSKERTIRIKYLLSRFNSVSVREISGVKLSKKLGGVYATHIIDPVFYLTKEDYISKLNIKKKENVDKYIFIYLRDVTECKVQFCEKIANKFKSKIYYANDDTEVELFLEKMLNSLLVITDSYHGVCFSLIFNKKYLCIINALRGSDRFLSLMDTFKLTPKLFLDENQLELDDDIFKIDENWELINKIVIEKAKSAQEWLVDAINNKKSLSFRNYSIRLVNYKLYASLKEFINYIKSKALYRYNCIFRQDYSNKIILFGAGEFGKRAIQEYKDRIAFFIDNSNKKWIENYPVYTLKKASKLIEYDTKIVITTSLPYQEEIKQQLRDAGFTNVSVYRSS